MQILPFCNILPPDPIFDNQFKHKTDNKIKLGYSVEFELLKLLELRFNFTSHFIDEQQDWGENLGNGTWTGSVGRVINKVTQRFFLI